MAIRGDEPMKMMHRAGHEDLATTMGNVREAEALEFLKEEVFPALPDELFSSGLSSEGPAQWANLRERFKKQRRPQRVFAR